MCTLPPRIVNHSYMSNHLHILLEYHEKCVRVASALRELPCSIKSFIYLIYIGMNNVNFYDFKSAVSADFTIRALYEKTRPPS